MKIPDILHITVKSLFINDKKHSKGNEMHASPILASLMQFVLSINIHRQLRDNMFQ